MNSFDVIIVGAGIIGLSAAYKLKELNSGIRICILEKENAPAVHQSGHNSGVIHSGIYYKPGSLKAENCLRGYKMLVEFCKENNVNYEICGKVITAINENESVSLRKLYENGKLNGLSGIALLSEKEIKEHEPNVNGIEGLYVPQTGIVDYKNVSEKIASIISNAGVKICYNEEVKNIFKTEKEYMVVSSRENFKSNVLLLCAGLQTDIIAKKLFGELKIKIIPFRGEYYRLKNTASKLVKNLIYPVPDPEFPFLGVHFTRRINGVVEAGPNAVLALQREGYKKSDFKITEIINTIAYKGFRKLAYKYWKTGLYEFYRSYSKKEFLKSLQKLIPVITSDDIEPYGSGIRAQACNKEGKLIDDFYFMESEDSVAVCNAPSPAATSCLSIGEVTAYKVLSKF